MISSPLGPVLTFGGVAAILVLTPGAGTAFLTSTVVAHGRRAGQLAALGLVLGAAIHATMAALGMSVLLRRFPGGLDWIAVIGGGYIVILGLRSTGRAIWPRPPTGGVQAAKHRFVRDGTLIALGNAPLPLFYLVVVPQYIPAGTSRLAGVALLSAIHLSMAAVWMATIVQLVGGAVEVLRKPAVRITLEVASGVVLVVLGVKSIAGAV